MRAINDKKDTEWPKIHGKNIAYEKRPRDRYKVQKANDRMKSLKQFWSKKTSFVL